jgi:hypothetical protein
MDEPLTVKQRTRRPWWSWRRPGSAQADDGARGARWRRLDSVPGISVIAVVPVVVIVFALATDLWIYADAKAQDDRGTPVVLSWGGFRLDTPVGWLAACLIVWIVFVPLYLVGRRN